MTLKEITVTAPVNIAVIKWADSSVVDLSHSSADTGASVMLS